jgi:hypothetical protein
VAALENSNPECCLPVVGRHVGPTIIPIVSDFLDAKSPQE